MVKVGCWSEDIQQGNHLYTSKNEKEGVRFFSVHTCYRVYVVVGDVSEEFELPVAALGVDDALKGPRELLDGHLLFGPRVLRRTVQRRDIVAM